MKELAISTTNLHHHTVYCLPFTYIFIVFYVVAIIGPLDDRNSMDLVVYKTAYKRLLELCFTQHLVSLFDSKAARLI